MEKTYGKLLDIAVKKATREPMEQLEFANITIGDGIMGNDRKVSPLRQVTVLAREDWEEVCRELEVELPWTTRRANMLIEGVQLEDSQGAQIRIGELLLQVTGKTAPCSRMEEALPGLQTALIPKWRGGVTCRVVSGGQVEVGDRVEFLKPAEN